MLDQSVKKFRSKSDTDDLAELGPKKLWRVCGDKPRQILPPRAAPGQRGQHRRSPPRVRRLEILRRRARGVGERKGLCQIQSACVRVRVCARACGEEGAAEASRVTRLTRWHRRSHDWHAPILIPFPTVIHWSSESRLALVDPADGALASSVSGSVELTSSTRRKLWRRCSTADSQHKRGPETVPDETSMRRELIVLDNRVAHTQVMRPSWLSQTCGTGHTASCISVGQLATRSWRNLT